MSEIQRLSEQEAVEKLTLDTASANAVNSLSQPLNDFVNNDSDPYQSPCHLHLIPCQLNKSVRADVFRFFYPVPLKESGTHNVVEPLRGEQFYSATFRGRELTGHVIQLPASSTGLVFQMGDVEKPTAVAEPADSEPVRAPSPDPDGPRRSPRKRSRLRSRNYTDQLNARRERKEAAVSKQTKKARTISMHAVARFDSVFAWNKDLDKNDSLFVTRAVHKWPRLSALIHAPL